MPWNMSNPLYRWKLKHGKLNKSVKHKAYTGGKKTLARRSHRRIRRAYPRRSWFRRHRPKTVPLAMSLGVAISLTSPNPWTGRAWWQDAMEGNFDGALYQAREKFLAIDADGKFHPNVLLQNWAPAIIGAGISVVGGRFLNRYIRRVPLIGKYISL